MIITALGPQYLSNLSTEVCKVKPLLKRDDRNAVFVNHCASGRIRTFVGLRPTDLQSVVIDHSTTDACFATFVAILAAFGAYALVVTHLRFRFG